MSEIEFINTPYPLKQKEQKMSEPITSIAIEIKPEFKVHLLNESGIDKAKTMAVKFSDLLHWLESEAGCLQGRELSLVKTKLEEASFFAKKAMAQNPANQK